MSEKARKRMLDSLVKLNEEIYEEVGDPETHARISQYENGIPYAILCP